MLGKGVAFRSEPSGCHAGFQRSEFSIVCLDSPFSLLLSPSYHFLSAFSLLSLCSFFLSPFFPSLFPRQNNFTPLPGTNSEMGPSKPIGRIEVKGGLLVLL